MGKHFIDICIDTPYIFSKSWYNYGENPFYLWAFLVAWSSTVFLIFPPLEHLLLYFQHLNTPYRHSLKRKVNSSKHVI